MSAPRGHRLSALAYIAMGLVRPAAPALAQVQNVPATVQPPFYSDPNPLWRSPALIGMGKLTLGDDPNNQLTLWDFARNPAGIVESDSGSTIQLRPGVATASAQQNMPTGNPTIHQTLDS